MCCFVKPGVVLLAWTDDQADPQYEQSKEAYEVLSNATDAAGRKLQIIKLHIPDPSYCTDEEVARLAEIGDGQRKARTAGTRGAASYINFYIANEANILQQFGGEKWDKEPFSVLSEAFPDRQVMAQERYCWAAVTSIASPNNDWRHHDGWVSDEKAPYQ